MRMHVPALPRLLAGSAYKSAAGIDRSEGGARIRSSAWRSARFVLKSGHLAR
jgi:hypothetical protein